MAHQVSTNPLNLNRIDWRTMATLTVAAVLWLIAYNVIEPLAGWITYDLVRLERGSPLANRSPSSCMTSPRFCCC